MIKQLIKKGLKAYTNNVPVRGRHKMVKYLGGMVSSETEIIDINGFNIEIDHAEFWCRTVYYGIYEEPLVNFLNKQIKEGDIVFDPGANMGYITAINLGLVGQEGKVYAFEPSRTCFQKLEANNDFSTLPNLRIFNAAISDQSGEAVFCDTPRVISRGYACLAEVHEPEDSDSYTVPTHAIDSFCAAHKIEHIRFLKLDIEGAELMALNGSHSMLRAGKIDFVLVETTIQRDDPEISKTNDQVFEILESHHYMPHLLSANGELIPVDIRNLENIRRDFIWKKPAA